MSFEQSRVRLPGGDIIGLRKQTVFTARGIPYADAERFKPPKVLESWMKPVDGTEPASVCPQRPSRLNSVTGDIIRGRKMEESCLHLTVATPVRVLEQKANLPVMVWFHGGACISGGGDLDCYSPESLASRGVVVVVSVTHRLGILGFLPIDGIAPANLGLLDCIAALRWVQMHISGLGGDPDQVTAMGQSAGACYILSMMVGDDCGGLFRRAILQSNPFGWGPYTGDIMKHLSGAAESALQVDPRTATVEELLDVQMEVLLQAKRMGLATGFWPHLGSYPLPDKSQLMERIRQVAPNYDLMIGWTENEGTAFVPMMSSYPTWSSIPWIGRLINYAVTWWYTRDVFIWPSQRFHRDYLEAGGKSCSYSFRWSPSQNPLGATHCLELPFLFGTWESWKMAPMIQGTQSKMEMEHLGDQVQKLWIMFASGKIGVQSPINFNLTKSFCL